MNVLRKLAGDSAIYGLGSVVPRVLNYFLVALHTRVFGAARYGQITELYAYIAILLVLLTFGLETGFFRFASAEKGEQGGRTYGSVFWFLGGTSTLFFGLTWLFLTPISGLMGYASRGDLILMLAGIIALDAWSAIIFDKLRLAGRAVAFCAIKITSVVINVGCNLLFLLAFPAWGLYDDSFGIGYVLLSNLLGSGASWLLAFWQTGGFPRWGGRAALATVFAFSLPLLIGGLGGTTNEFLDRFLIQWFTPSSNPLAEVGIYGANAKIAVLMIICVQMFKFAAEPFFFKEAASKADPKVYALVTKWFTYFTLAMLVGICFCLPVVQYFVGPEFRQGLHVVPILLVANVLYGLYFNVSIWFKILNKTWYAVLLTFTGAAVTVGVNMLLTPHISYFGAAWARVACYALMVTLCVAVGNRYFRIPYEWSKFAIAALLCGAIGYIGMVLPIDSSAWLLAARFGLGIVLVEAILRIEGLSLLKIITQWKLK